MSKKSRPWTRQQRRAIRRRAAKSSWVAPETERYEKPTVRRLSGRRSAEVAFAMMAASGPVHPWFFGLDQPTSARRRWSQLTGVKMQRERPHPRPYEQPTLVSLAPDSGGVWGATALAGSWSNRLDDPSGEEP